MIGMAVNKIVYGATVLVDLTSDTVTAGDLRQGVTAHGADGEPVVGSLTFATVYSGSSAPDDSVGYDGDIYLQI